MILTISSGLLLHIAKVDEYPSSISVAANSFSTDRYSINECYGACINIEKPDQYNERIHKAIKYLNFENKNFAIIDKGRNIDESSFVLVENGLFIGLGYFNLNFQINNIKVLKKIIISMEHNKDNQQIIQSFLRKAKGIKILNY